MILYSNEKYSNEVVVVEHEKPDYKKYAGYALGALGVYMLFRRKKRRK